MDMNPGIKKTVAWLNARGWPTIDSGDGETHDHECDREYAYVVIRLPSYRARHLIEEVEGLASALRQMGVPVESLGPEGVLPGCCNLQGNYSTDGNAFIDIAGLRDSLLFRPESEWRIQEALS